MTNQRETIAQYRLVAQKATALADTAKDLAAAVPVMGEKDVQAHWRLSKNILDLLDAALGDPTSAVRGGKSITAEMKCKCAACNGYGAVRLRDDFVPCDACNGRGY